MTGAHGMQELKYFRGGATLVISMDGLDWLSKRKCRDKGLQKRDEELHLWIPSAQMTQADEERQPVTCFCILNQRESSTSKSRRNTDSKSSSLSLSPRHRCLLKKPIHQSTFTSIHPFITDFPKEVAWTKLILNMRDIIGLITKYLNIATQQDTITVYPNKKCVMFYDDFISEQLFSDLYFTPNFRILLGHTGSHINENNNVPADSENSPTYCHLAPDSEDDHSETIIRDNVNLRSLLKSCQSYNDLGESSGRRRKMKLRKSVSFDDDVMVYLFDKESPTLELHSESCTSLPSSNSCNLSVVTSDSAGLEWEDDFSALENNCHFQHSMPKQSWTSMPRTEHCSLSQKCLFLTYVTESDLEL